MTTLPDIREKGLEGAIGWLFPHLVMASSTYLNGVDAAQIRDIRDRLLALAADQADPWLASITMMAVGNVTIADLHEVETGQNYLWEALALSRKIGESFWRGWMLGSLADWARWGGDYDLAGALYTEAYELAMHLRDRPLTASLLWRLGRTDEAQGLSEQAREKLKASMALAREIGVRPFIAVPLYLLGSLEARDGHFDAARSYYAEAYSLLVDDGDPQLMSFCLYNHALGALEQGDYQRAKECAQESLEWMRKASHTDWWTAVIKLGEAEYGLGNVETARAHFQSALLGSQGAVALRPDIPHGLIAYAILLADEGQAERAVELLGRALSDQAIFAHDRAQAQAMITALAETLSAEAFAAARVRGETATVEELMIGLQQAAGGPR
jgi:tetratricopeptide (TPR) repeat protein